MSRICWSWVLTRDVHSVSHPGSGTRPRFPAPAKSTGIYIHMFAFVIKKEHLMKHLAAHEASLGLEFLRDKRLQQTTLYVVYHPWSWKLSTCILFISMFCTLRETRLRFFLCKICTRSMHPKNAYITLSLQRSIRPEHSNKVFYCLWTPTIAVAIVWVLHLIYSNKVLPLAGVYKSIPSA